MRGLRHAAQIIQAHSSGQPAPLSGKQFANNKLETFDTEWRAGDWELNLLGTTPSNTRRHQYGQTTFSCSSTPMLGEHACRLGLEPQTRLLVEDLFIQVQRRKYGPDFSRETTDNNNFPFAGSPISPIVPEQVRESYKSLVLRRSKVHSQERPARHRTGSPSSLRGLL